MSEVLVPSTYQQALYDFVQHQSGSAVVIAVAGSGKTHSILEAIQLISSTESVQLFAFNTAIAQELRNRIPKHLRHVTASTFHSVGYRALCSHFMMKSIKTNGRKLQQICREKMGWDDRRRYEAFICKLVDLARGIGIGCVAPDEPDAWQSIVDHHDLYLDDPYATEERGIEYARRLLAWSTAAAETNYLIDFSDQLYLTILWNLPVDRKDWVFVDEAQDVNPIRLALIDRAVKPGGRVIAVGDPKQSIYAFTGALSDAIDKIWERYQAIELPLSVSYRCPKAIVKQAQTLVPYIEASPFAAEGIVEDGSEREILSRLQPTDAVLCRNNAPLVDLAYKCLSQGIGCQILGRDIGKNLQTLIEKMGATEIDDIGGEGLLTIPGLLTKLGEYRTREVARLLAKDQHSKAQSVADRVDCIQTIVDNLPEAGRTLAGLASALDRLFGDNPAGRLTLSTVHKAKGKEWPQVAILKPELMPAPWADQDWEIEQEDNLRYVAWTRARAALFFIRE